MGWNDRVPDAPPYIPYENPADRDEYENWQMYLEYCRQHPEEFGGISSQNVDPAALPRPTTPRPVRTAVRELLRKLKDLISK